MNPDETHTERLERHKAHQAMLDKHAAVKQERVERMRKERFQGKPRKYAGNIY